MFRRRLRQSNFFLLLLLVRQFGSLNGPFSRNPSNPKNVWCTFLPFRLKVVRDVALGAFQEKERKPHFLLVLYFHITLATVNQSNFPVQLAVEEIKQGYTAWEMA